MRRRIKRIFLFFIKCSGINLLFLHVPSQFKTVREWLDSPGSDGKIISLINPMSIREIPPIVIGYKITKRFSKFYNRSTREAFVAIISKGRVLGEFTNIIISPDNIVLSDVSREFGAEGGRPPQDFSIFKDRFLMPDLIKLTGKVAVISTSGCSNFHHWNYDTLPRLYLLKLAGLLESVDYFLIHYTRSKFQQEGLKELGIDESKIVNTHGIPDYYAEADELLVPSLSEDLGTITPWVLDFLRSTFLKNIRSSVALNKLYLTRKNAPSRRITNNEEVLQVLRKNGYTEFVPDNYSMKEVASIFAASKSIVSVHGSGLSNLAFISEGTKVLDILAPYHQDSYYWMITNQRNSKYVTFFAEGEHPPDDLDLVKRKIDSDLVIDISKLQKALNALEND